MNTDELHSQTQPRVLRWSQASTGSRDLNRYVERGLTFCSSITKGSMSSRPLRIAIVAPSLGILGGQAVQADRLVHAWRNDPDVDARLVPINPIPRGALRHGLKVKYRPDDPDPADLLAAPLSRAAAGRRRARVLGVVLLVSPRAAAGDADRLDARQARAHELPERRGAGPPRPVPRRPMGARTNGPERGAVRVPRWRLLPVWNLLPGRPQHRESRRVQVPPPRESGASPAVDAKPRAAVQPRVHASSVPDRGGPVPRRYSDDRRQRIPGSGAPPTHRRSSG